MCELPHGGAPCDRGHPGPDVQEVLRRRYILGQSYGDIADAVGVVLRRVYQIHRAGVLALELEETEEKVS